MMAGRSGSFPQQPSLMTSRGNCDPAVTRPLPGQSRMTGFVFRNWSGARDLNPGPHGPEPCALPNCASPRRESDSIGALLPTLTAGASRWGGEVQEGRTSLGNLLPVSEREPAG